LKVELAKRILGVRWGLGLILGLVIFTWPLFLHPCQLMGHVQGEASNHLWMFWRSGQVGSVSNFPTGVGLALMDPVNLPVYRAFSWGHPAFAFNAVWVFNLIVAFVGAFSLARALGVGRAAAVSAGVGCAFSPFLSGLGSFGITEAWPIGWLGIHFACLICFSESRRKVHVFGAALALAAFLFSGWYSAVFVAVAEPMLWFYLLRRGAPLGALVLQAVAAGLLVLPRFLAFLSDREIWADRWGNLMHGQGLASGRWDAWRELPRSGADALNLVLPSTFDVPVSKSVYLGLVLLFFAMMAGRRARVLWLWSAPFLLLSLGLTLSIAGFHQFGGVRVAMPAGWLVALFPSLEGLSHWFRALAPVTLFLAVAASMGVERLASKRSSWVWIAPVLLLADSVFLSQTPWPRSQFSIEPPVVYSRLQLDGAGPDQALLQLPLHNARREFTLDEPRVYNRWQPVHGLPVAENYEGSDSVLDQNRLVQMLQQICLGDSVGAPELTLVSQEMWLGDLRKKGFGYLVVHGVAEREPMDAWQCGRSGSGRSQRSEAYQDVNAVLSELLGAPEVVEGGDAFYFLGEP
jgi:hypothetical protein